MNPALLALILEALIKFGPAAVQSIVEAAHKENPTLEDWKAAFAPAHKSYEEYVKKQS